MIVILKSEERKNNNNNNFFKKKSLSPFILQILEEQKFIKKTLKDRAWSVFAYHSKITCSKQYLGYYSKTSAMHNYERKPQFFLEYGPHARIHLWAKAKFENINSSSSFFIPQSDFFLDVHPNLVPEITAWNMIFITPLLEQRYRKKTLRCISGIPSSN